jgi:hypothetical protein
MQQRLTTQVHLSSLFRRGIGLDIRWPSLPRPPIPGQSRFDANVVVVAGGYRTLLVDALRTPPAQYPPPLSVTAGFHETHVGMAPATPVVVADVVDVLSTSRWRHVIN